jgi:lipopolysaccharide transport system ATP-binding protein
MPTAIKVEHVSKQYRLGLVGSGTMRDDMERWWYRMRGKEDPTLKLGETNDRSKLGDSDYVWALRDINFDVNQGEVLGIIGKNGAGKSTLLKLLSRVTAPTIGHIKAKGRIASLLEVGTGFHPELTGKENIFLNGAIMGMKKHEIARKLDEIVDFAGVERYLETPVKRYSSGMYVRLAFAVAAHLEPEILIVDEVLAVGDLEFQKKCITKMKNVSTSGKTVLFVSHNLASISSLCTTCLYLKSGQLINWGVTDKIVDQYQQDTFSTNQQNVSGNQVARCTDLVILNHNGSKSSNLELHKPASFIVTYDSDVDLNDVSLSVCFDNDSERRITSLWNEFIPQILCLHKGINIFQFDVPHISLIPGSYSVITYLGKGGQIIEQIGNLANFTVSISENIDLNVIPIDAYGTYVESYQIQVLQ